MLHVLLLTQVIQVEVIKCQLGSHIEALRKHLLELMSLFIHHLNRINALSVRNPDRLTQQLLQQTQAYVHGVWSAVDDWC
jgi:hypothetical protein